MDRVYSLEELRAALTPVFEEYGVRKAVLFGSYAKGSATGKSDVDLLVDSGLKGLRFFGLLDELNDTLGCPVDLIDVVQLEKNSPVAYEIQRSGVKIYEQ